MPRIELKNGWQEFEAGFEGANYRVVNGICYLQGLIKQPRPLQPHQLIAVLPPEARPKGRLIFITGHQDYHEGRGGGGGR